MPPPTLARPSRRRRWLTRSSPPPPPPPTVTSPAAPCPRTTCLVFCLAMILMLHAESVSAAAAVPAMRYASRIVDTKSGQIRGILQDLNSQHLDPVEVFRGIPYAAAPQGDLRFRPPQPPQGWKGTKRADTFGPACPQKLPDISNRTAALQDMPLARYNQLLRLFKYVSNHSEDCLYLNLYIPGSGARGLEAPYAVMVFIHGESFEWGSGHIYDGSVLASAGHVIVITLNYRLGILGFLRTKPLTESAESAHSGNLALHDIAMALTWIRENIGSFGGDPTRVTLMGHDTGAALVNYLLLAPFGKGLFHNVVLLSGSALSPWAAVHDPNDLREQVAKQLDCRSTDEDIAECLRQVSLEALLGVELTEIKFMPAIGPSLPIDGSHPDPSLDMERLSDAFIKVPIVLGVCTAESYLDFNANDIQYGFEEDQRNRVLRTFVRNAYFYHLNEIFSAVRNEYTDWDKPVLHPINIRESTMEALSDGHTVAPLMKIAFYHARRGAQTYFFHFNYQSKDSEYPQRLGSVRGESLPYILGLPLTLGGRFFPQNFSRADQVVAEAVLTFFTNFAKTGNPNEPHAIESVDYGTVKEKTRYRGLTWDKYETNTQQYLMIALKPKMKNHYRGHKMAVWLNLIPQLHQPGDDVSMRHHHFREKGDLLYSGPVRDEWYTPLALPGAAYASSTRYGQSQSSQTSSTSCATTGENGELLLAAAPSEDSSSSSPRLLEEGKDGAELLQRLASKHYYSTTTALAITVGVGCILLVLNMLIFAGIYYQRDRDKKRALAACKAAATANPTNSNGQDMQSLAMPMMNDHRSPKDPRHRLSVTTDLPPCYTTLPKSPSSIQDHMQDPHPMQASRLATLPRGPKEQHPPRPPQRTSSSLTTSVASGTLSSGVKKRVQIQEITV
ncbi:neuroligin-4, X-linked-like [Trichogramma pretiosum]|uniref:neuroligin-4, X-linked-like n=1 Tax=Trichogramma pretiosum TaxID=7493 RepID=UPI000C71AF1B|nr:neuroligin-4, X-linked-like [Trichogramma pretiosum]